MTPFGAFKFEQTKTQLWKTKKNLVLEIVHEVLIPILYEAVLVHDEKK